MNKIMQVNSIVPTIYIYIYMYILLLVYPTII